jgi:N-glycosidase YbiA
VEFNCLGTSSTTNRSTRLYEVYTLMVEWVSFEKFIENTDTIDSFTDDYRFLSNFWPAEVTLDGIKYTTVEHAYQAAKTVIPEERESIQIQPSPGRAKRAGKDITLRPNWNEIKVHIMEDLLRQKFKYPELKQLLLDTGDKTLIEGNTWGDTFWGMCNGVGENMLGKLLMQIRKEIT